jgi:hypothetical protein
VIYQKRHFVCRLSCPALLFGLICQTLGFGAEPRIDRIEFFLQNQITIHFDTEPDRTYALQYLDGLTCSTNGIGICSSNAVPTAAWSNLWVAPNIPFPNHYVIVDYKTNRSRFYRLKVTR